ncbi:MAG: DUF3786 domain-containing protein [Methanoregula sp.]|nr:DUF3786 domain-containing protein [Methanoregula sp.]
MTGAGAHGNFERCRESLRSLRGRPGFPDTPLLSILDLHLSPEDGTITCGPEGTPVPGIAPALFCILDGYAKSHEVPEQFSLLPFEKTPGASAYSAAFHRRAILPLAEAFGRDPGRTGTVIESLRAVPVAFADLAWKLYPLPRVPVYILFWDGTGEFPSSANLLFDASVPAYLETEQIAMLGELTAERILARIATQ